jgi:NADH:ubiquinone oxidoreductase subunit 2 (subunit N)
MSIRFTASRHSHADTVYVLLLPSTISAMIRVFFCSSASLLMSLNTSSISSSVLPAVSGTQKNVNTNARRQKTAKKVYAPAPVFWMRGGVMSPCDVC